MDRVALRGDRSLHAPDGGGFEKTRGGVRGLVTSLKQLADFGSGDPFVARFEPDGIRVRESVLLNQRVELGGCERSADFSVVSPVPAFTLIGAVARRS